MDEAAPGAGRRRRPVQDGVEDHDRAGPDGEEREGGRGHEAERVPLRGQRSTEGGGVEEVDVRGVENRRRGALEARDVGPETPPTGRSPRGGERGEPVSEPGEGEARRGVRGDVLRDERAEPLLAEERGERRRVGAKRLDRPERVHRRIDPQALDGRQRPVRADDRAGLRRRNEAPGGPRAETRIRPAGVDDHSLHPLLEPREGKAGRVHAASRSPGSARSPRARSAIRRAFSASARTTSRAGISSSHSTSVVTGPVRRTSRS